MAKHGQVVKFIRADGEEIVLHTPPTRSVANMTGWGYPPTAVHTVTGPFQHGANVLGYRFQPRTIALDVIKPNCTRSAWYTERSNLIDKLGLQSTNPNLPELGRLQWNYIENDTLKRRAVDCYLSGGLSYNVDPKWWEYGILESLTFIANNPIIYDPTQATVTIGTFDTELELPMTFPFLLGAAEATQNITYEGSWAEFPIIEIDGPTNGVYIENTTTGIALRLNYYITSGVTVTFDLTEGNKTVTDSMGNNLIQYIVNSNLAQFSLEPNPTAAGGINSIYVVVTDNDSNTEVRIKYYTRFVGV